MNIDPESKYKNEGTLGTNKFLVEKGTWESHSPFALTGDFTYRAYSSWPFSFLNHSLRNLQMES